MASVVFRTNAEKREAIRKALEVSPGKSSRWIASICGVTHGLVENVRREIKSKSGPLPVDEGTTETMGDIHRTPEPPVVRDELVEMRSFDDLYGEVKTLRDLAKCIATACEMSGGFRRPLPESNLLSHIRGSLHIHGFIDVDGRSVDRRFFPAGGVLTVKCRECGRDFIASRSDAMYCSSPCKQAAYRKRIADSESDGRASI